MEGPRLFRWVLSAVTRSTVPLLNFLKLFPRTAIRTAHLYAPYYLFRYGYLRDISWYSSYHHQTVTGVDGEPVPWLNYPIIHFLSERIKPDMTVFEYGAGNSTVWWASRVKQVISVEHAHEWYDALVTTVPANVELIFADHTDVEHYSGIVAKYTGQFDILVIDSRHRISCAKNGLTSLKADGVIIWDDTEREEYAEGYQILVENGFRRLDFTGMGPARVEGWTTTIFYRTDNCLCI